MSYLVTVKSGRLLEMYSYEQRPKPPSRKAVQNRHRSSSGDVSFEAGVHTKKPRERRQSSIIRCRRNFKRLVLSNLGESNFPVFASLTYAENMQDERKATKDFNAFAKSLRRQFGSTIRFIATKERQKRGAIHFHALIWGIPSFVVRGERNSRLVAEIWGHGFADLIQTDGDPRVASYMAKYMSKNFLIGRSRVLRGTWLPEILGDLK